MEIKHFLETIKEYFNNQEILTEEEEAILEETEVLLEKYN